MSSGGYQKAKADEEKDGGEDGIGEVVDKTRQLALEASKETQPSEPKGATNSSTDGSGPAPPTTAGSGSGLQTSTTAESKPEGGPSNADHGDSKDSEAKNNPPDIPADKKSFKFSLETVTDDERRALIKAIIAYPDPESEDDCRNLVDKIVSALPESLQGGASVKNVLAIVHPDTCGRKLGADSKSDATKAFQLVKMVETKLHMEEGIAINGYGQDTGNDGDDGDGDNGDGDDAHDRKGLLDYHKRVYKIATTPLQKIYELADPMQKNAEPYRNIEALNAIIKDQNKKNGKKENMGIIRPTNFAASWKAVKNPKYIQKFPNGKAMAIEAMQGICDLYGYPRGWSQFPPIFSDGGNSTDDTEMTGTAEEKYWQEAYEEMNDYFEEIRSEYLQHNPKRILEVEETLLTSMEIINETLKVSNVEHGQPEYAHIVDIHTILESWDQAYKANKSGNNAELEAAKKYLASFCDKHGYPAAWGEIPILYTLPAPNTSMVLRPKKSAWGDRLEAEPNVVPIREVTWNIQEGHTTDGKRIEAYQELARQSYQCIVEVSENKHELVAVSRCGGKSVTIVTILAGKVPRIGAKNSEILENSLSVILSGLKFDGVAVGRSPRGPMPAKLPTIYVRMRYKLKGRDEVEWLSKAFLNGFLGEHEANNLISTLMSPNMPIPFSNPRSALEANRDVAQTALATGPLSPRQLTYTAGRIRQAIQAEPVAPVPPNNDWEQALAKIALTV